jgi:putative membrane protein
MKIVPANPNGPDDLSFWQHAFNWGASATPLVLTNLILFTLWSLAVTLIHDTWPWATIAVGPLEATGAVLAIVLVFRVNAGYDRWWEARKLWGGIVNQSRNLTLSALAYGPRDPAWRRQFVGWTASFCHSARCSLRGESCGPDIRRLLGPEAEAQVSGAVHVPSMVVLKLAGLLRRAPGLDGFAFLQIDHERAELIDHIGACERILRTPVPRAAAIKIRRFIFLFLMLLPFALVGKMGWFTPAVMFFITYPVLSLDAIGTELQSPFSRQALSHLPLNEICTTIERNLYAALEAQESFETGHLKTMESASLGSMRL